MDISVTLSEIKLALELPGYVFDSQLARLYLEFLMKRVEEAREFLDYTYWCYQNRFGEYYYTCKFCGAQGPKKEEISHKPDCKLKAWLEEK